MDIDIHWDIVRSRQDVLNIRLLAWRCNPKNSLDNLLPCCIGCSLFRDPVDRRYYPGWFFSRLRYLILTPNAEANYPADKYQSGTVGPFITPLYSAALFRLHFLSI